MRVVIVNVPSLPNHPHRIFYVPDNLVSAFHIFKGGNADRIIKTLERELGNSRIWIDSGGFQILKMGVDIKLDELIAWYRKLEGIAYIYFSLDYPPQDNDDKKAAAKKFEASYQNWLKLEKVFGDRVIPVVHNYPQDLSLYYKYLERYVNEHSVKRLAIGKVVQYTSRRNELLVNVIRLIYKTRMLFKGHLHVLGMGSPSLLSTLDAIGVDTTDSSSWVQRCFTGHLLMPGGASLYVSIRRERHREMMTQELAHVYEFLARTGFPDLRDFARRVVSDKAYRCAVNAWISMKSRELPISPFYRRLYYAVVTGEIMSDDFKLDGSEEE